jgi:hypothetical protein
VEVHDEQDFEQLLEMVSHVIRANQLNGFHIAFYEMYSWIEAKIPTLLHTISTTPGRQYPPWYRQRPPSCRKANKALSFISGSAGWGMGRTKSSHCS